MSQFVGKNGHISFAENFACRRGNQEGLRVDFADSIADFREKVLFRYHHQNGFFAARKAALPLYQGGRDAESVDELEVDLVRAGGDDEYEPSAESAVKDEVEDDTLDREGNRRVECRFDIAKNDCRRGYDNNVGDEKNLSRLDMPILSAQKSDDNVTASGCTSRAENESESQRHQSSAENSCEQAVIGDGNGD